jgi:hypothetical protein
VKATVTEPLSARAVAAAVAVTEHTPLAPTTMDTPSSAIRHEVAPGSLTA